MDLSLLLQGRSKSLGDSFNQADIPLLCVNDCLYTTTVILIINMPWHPGNTRNPMASSAFCFVFVSWILYIFFTAHFD